MEPLEDVVGFVAALSSWIGDDEGGDVADIAWPDLGEAVAGDLSDIEFFDAGPDGWGGSHEGKDLLTEGIGSEDIETELGALLCHIWTRYKILSI